MATRRTKHKTPRNRYNEKQVLGIEATDRPEGTKTYIVTAWYDVGEGDERVIVKWSTDVYAVDVMEAAAEGMAAMDLSSHHVLKLGVSEA